MINRQSVKGDLLMNKKLMMGVQMFTVKEQAKELGIDGVFKKINELGYPSVEVSQLPMDPDSVKMMQEASQKYGIKVASLSAALETDKTKALNRSDNLEDDYDKIVSDCKKLNCDLLRIGMLPIQYMASKESAMSFVDKAEKMANKLAKDGIDLYYHNHHVEFAKYGDKTLLEIIRDNTESLGFEIDIHWVQRGGMNPVEVLKSFAGRIRLLHLKDFKVIPFVAPEDPKNFMQEFSNIVRFAPVGDGNLDIKSCIEAAKEGGCEYFLVEQDDCYGEDPFDCLARSKKYLEKIGYSEWFRK